MDIRLESLYKSFACGPVFEGFSHRFPEGSITCLLGPSGCGKTTLLRLIAGLEVPDSGAICGIEGQKISAVFQEDRLLLNLSAERNLLLTARSGFTRADAQALLAALGLESRPSLLRQFSGGMRRRVAIARALAADWELLLLDEPFSGLDEGTRNRAVETILDHRAGRTLICATHDEADAARFGAEVLHLSGSAR